MKKGILWFLPGALCGAAAGGTLVKRLWLEKYRAQKAELSEAETERDLLFAWLTLEQSGKKCAAYLEARGFTRVAVFGMNRLGRRLIDELGGMAVYGIELDHPGAVHERLTVYRLGDDPLPEAECVVLCDLEHASEKREALSQKFHGPIVTLAEILEEKR